MNEIIKNKFIALLVLVISIAGVVLFYEITPVLICKIIGNEHKDIIINITAGLSLLTLPFLLSRYKKRLDIIDNKGK